MNKKQRMKSVIGCVITLGLTIMLLWYSTDLMERKESDEKYTPFFEQEEDFNVLFLGSSHTINGIFPMELWNDYGIISYNFGGHGNRLATSYWVMENALDYTSPELIVIDCYMLSESYKIVPDSSHTHVFDAFPLSKTKVSAVFDLLDNKDKTNEFVISEDAKPTSRMELLWDYIIYHTRWDELEKEDFQSESEKEKGAESRIAVRVPEEKIKIPVESKLEEDTVSVIYLQKMIEDCQERGIDVLLIYLPFPAGEKEQKEANRVYDIAGQYGVNYINFLDVDIIRDETDYYDAIGHLNPSGARKVTDYLGQYIMEHYSVSDQRENEAYSGWYTDYADYVEEKINNLREYESLENYLMLLADKNFSAVIEINNPAVYSSDSYLHPLENLGVNSSELTESTDFIVIEEAGKQAECFENFHESGSCGITALGEFSLFPAEDGTYGVYLDNEEFYTITPEQNMDADVRITVIDKDTKAIVDQSAFFAGNDESQIFRKK